MKRLLPIIAVLLFAPATNAQTVNEWCGYKPTPEQHALHIKAAQESRDWQYAGKSGATSYIPIKIHSVGDNDGVGHISNRTALDIICELNDDFAATDFHFYMYGSLDYINNTTVDNGNATNWFYNANNDDNVVNVYIAGSAGTGLCGYFTWGGDAIMMSRNCAGKGDKTFPHEMGHYFYLAHTFNDFDAGDLYNSEWVTRTLGLRNCESVGDGYCDTEADYLPGRWNCFGATHTQKDYRGDTYDPDETLFMSYASDACIDRFSAQQISGMNFVLNTYRPDLKVLPDPNVTTLTSPNLTKPGQGEVDVPINYVEFEWDPVPGADKYHLICSRFNVNSDYKLAVDVIVEGQNWYTAVENDEFEEYKYYDWIVKPINGSTCASYSSKGAFQTGESIVISGISSSGTGNELAVVPNVVDGNDISLFISGAGSFTGTATVMSVNGAVVATEVLNVSDTRSRYTINADLPSGVYLVKVTGEGVQYQDRFVVSK